MPQNQDYGFKKPGNANKGTAVGPQGAGGSRPGAEAKGINNPRGNNAKSHGSKKANLSPEKQRGGF